jgi:hypothetical protein
MPRSYAGILYLGDALMECGNLAQATEHWEIARRILTPLGGTDAAAASRRPA